MKKTIVVVALLAAAAAAAALLARQPVREALETRGTLASTQTVSEDAWTRRAGLAPPALPASLTIQGEVVGGGSASGTLTLRVGSTVSTQPITVSPGYSFVLSGAQSSDMVSIEIVTPTYKYASLLGSYAKLVRHAGSDAYLTATELDRTRVSAFSTSLHYFTQREMGGRLPVSDNEHERVIRSVAGEDLAIATRMLVSTSDGTYSLPPGHANGYELLQDQFGYRMFLAEHTDLYYTDDSSYLSSIPSVPVRIDQLGTHTLFSTAIPFGDVAVISPTMNVLSRTNGGWEIHSGSRRNPLFTANQLSSGEIELIAQNDNVYSEAYVSAGQLNPQCPHCQTRERYTIVRTWLRQIFVGERHSLWMVGNDLAVTYPDYPAEAPRYVEGYPGILAASKLDGLLPFSATELVGQRALPVFCKQGSPVSLANCETAVQRFNPNGSGFGENVGWKIDAGMQPYDPIGGEPFQWRNARYGPLTLAYADSAVTYWRTDLGDEAVDVLVYVARSNDGADTVTVAGHAAMINADLPGDFTALDPVGTWKIGSFEQYKQPYGYVSSNEPPVTSRFIRNADGTSVRKDVTEYDPADGGPYELSIRYGWQLLDGILYETRYRANATTGIANTVGFSSCAQAFARGATQCAPQQVRYFQPLARVGNRLYGIQETYSNFSNTPPFSPSRSAYASYLEKK